MLQSNLMIKIFQGDGWEIIRVIIFYKRIKIMKNILFSIGYRKIIWISWMEIRMVFVNIGNFGQ